MRNGVLELVCWLTKNTLNMMATFQNKTKLMHSFKGLFDEENLLTTVSGLDSFLALVFSSTKAGSEMKRSEEKQGRLAKQIE